MCHNALRSLWKRNAEDSRRSARRETKRYLRRKLNECETREGRSTVFEAMALRRQYPDLSGPELIRLAYWGTTGSPI